MSLKLGCIADDFTGATDLANNLARAGMRCVQTIGVRDDSAARVPADAIVIALKSRTIPSPSRPSRNLWPHRAGCRIKVWSRCTSNTARLFIQRLKAISAP